MYNYQGWSTHYLGWMISEGTTLTADWVSEWNLGASGKLDPVVHKHNWFGMIRPGFSIGLQKLYYHWIHKYRYGRN